MADLRAAKIALRQSIKDKYSGVEADSPTIASESSLAQDLVLRQQEYKRASRVGIYLSMPSAEVQTDAIIHDAFASGKSVFVPYLYRPDESFKGDENHMKRVMDLLKLHSIEEYKGLQKDRWGIPSLAASSVDQRRNCMGGLGLSMKEPVDAPRRPPSGSAHDVPALPLLELLIMPGVAFDARCHRLGHGGGFYDNFIARCTELGNGRPVFGSTIGLALSGQVVDEVPANASDWPVDTVIVGDGRLYEHNEQ